MGIVVSRADSASVHIGERLRSLAEWTAETDPDRPDGAGGGAVYRTAGAELREFDALHLEVEGAADPFDDPSLLVFASRHSGETGPLLSAHFTGNVGPAEFGGEDGRLARAAPNALRTAIATLDRHAPPDYEVAMECTHHGPTDLDVPTLFVELGSDADQWADPAGADAVARTILDLRGTPPERDRQVVGIGGGHYAPRFRRVLRETDWAVGHVAADWSLETAAPLEESMVRQLFERSGADRALIDGDHPSVESRIQVAGYETVSETWLRETTGVPLPLVDQVETTLGGVEEGVRFGTPGREGIEAPVENELLTVSLHPELVRTVNGIDTVATRQAVDRVAVAFSTADGGSRVAGQLVVSTADAIDPLIDDFLAILEDRYESAERSEETVIMEEQAFDPDRARALGVPEGPAFGRLTAGETVTIDGKLVAPDDVHVERTTRLPVRADGEGS